MGFLVAAYRICRGERGRKCRGKRRGFKFMAVAKQTLELLLFFFLPSLDCTLKHNKGEYYKVILTTSTYMAL